MVPKKWAVKSILLRENSGLLQKSLWATFPRESLGKNGIFSFKIRVKSARLWGFMKFDEDWFDFAR